MGPKQKKRSRRRIVSTFSVTLDDDLNGLMLRYCQATGLNKTDVARKALEAYLPVAYDVCSVAASPEQKNTLGI